MTAGSSDPFSIDAPPGVLAAALDRVAGRHHHPVEFPIVRAAEPAVRVAGIPDTASIPPPVMEALGLLAAACIEAYGLGVEVEEPGEREAARLGLETLRRYLL